MPQVVAVMMPCESTRAAGHQGDISIMEHTRWAARYNTWLLIKLTPKGIVFSLLFWSTHTDMQPSIAYSAALYCCHALLV